MSGSIGTPFPLPPRSLVAGMLRPMLLALALLVWPGLALRQFPASSSGDRPLATRGTTYYVSRSGDDANPGTADHPWRTIQKAADSLVAGDTVFITAGTYQEMVRPRNSGAPDAYITYSAYPGDVVTIDGADVTMPDWDGLFDITGRSYIRISGLRIVNAGSTLHNPAVLVDHAAHITIEHNEIYHAADAGVRVWGSANVVLDGNEIEDACHQGYSESISVGATDGFEIRNNHVHDSIKAGIDVKNGSSNGRVYRNHVHHTADVGLYVDAYEAHTYNIEVFSNVVHDVADDGIGIAAERGGLLENVSIYNNAVFNNKSVGIYVSDCCSASHPMRDIQIVNNTLYDNGWSTWGGGILIDNPQVRNILIRNNLVSQNLSFQIAVHPDLSLPDAIIDHSLIDGFRGNLGEVWGDDFVEGDPLFVNAAGGNLRLGPLSPAIDRASAVGAPALDLDGLPRPYGPGCDIGAYERIPVDHVWYVPIIVMQRR